MRCKRPTTFDVQNCGRHRGLVIIVLSQPHYCQVIATLLPCHAVACCHAIAMPCCCHAVAMLLPRCCHAIAMPLPCCCHAVATLLPCSCHAFALPLPFAMTLPCHRHVVGMLLPCCCHAVAVLLPLLAGAFCAARCRCRGFTMGCSQGTHRIASLPCQSHRELHLLCVATRAPTDCQLLPVTD